MMMNQICTSTPNIPTIIAQRAKPRPDSVLLGWSSCFRATIPITSPATGMTKAMMKPTSARLFVLRAIVVPDRRRL